jgi:hypothetical protein
MLLHSLTLTGVGTPASGGGGGSYPVVSRSASDSYSGNNCGSSMVCTFSPAPASGRLLLAFLRDGTGSSNGPPSNGTGTTWTQLGTSGRVWYAYTNSAQPTSYSITYYGVAKADSACFDMIEITGVAATPLDTWNATSASAVSPSITTSFVNEVVLSIIFSSSLAGTDLTVPSGWTLVRRDSSGGISGASAIGIAYKNFATAGATGTATWTLATGSADYVFTIGVRSV